MLYINTLLVLCSITVQVPQLQQRNVSVHNSVAAAKQQRHFGEGVHLPVVNKRI
jgi:hypothetical protein